MNLQKDVISTFPLVLNSTNLDATSYPNNNRYRYVFPSPANFKNSQVALQGINIFFSWNNITAANGNNTFSYIFPSLVPVTTTVTIPDGYYSVAQLNNYLESIMIGLGQYLVDANGNYVYYIQFTTNSTYYAVELDSYAFPSALPMGYTNPSGIALPLADSTPQVVIPAGGFSTLIGFTPGTYPPAIQATTYSHLSDFTPQVDVVQSIIVTCNLLNNLLSQPNSIIGTFTTGNSSFGALVSYEPNEAIFVNIAPGQYSSIEISFLDQAFSPLIIQDTNVTITLLLRVDQSVRN